MAGSLLVITKDPCLEATLNRFLEDSYCIVRYEKNVMRALLAILQKAPDVFMADLEIGCDLIIHSIDVMKTKKIQIPIIAIYEDESKPELSELCGRGISYRFQKPLNENSIDQLKQVVEILFEDCLSG